MFSYEGAAGPMLLGCHNRPVYFEPATFAHHETRYQQPEDPEMEL